MQEAHREGSFRQFRDCLLPHPFAAISCNCQGVLWILPPHRRPLPWLGQAAPLQFQGPLRHRPHVGALRVQELWVDFTTPWQNRLGRRSRSSHVHPSPKRRTARLASRSSSRRMWSLCLPLGVPAVGRKRAGQTVVAPAASWRGKRKSGRGPILSEPRSLHLGAAQAPRHLRCQRGGGQGVLMTGRQQPVGRERNRGQSRRRGVAKHFMRTTSTGSRNGW